MTKTTLAGGMPVQVSRVDLVKDLVIEGYPNGDETALQTWQVAHDATIIEEDGTEVQIAPEDVQFQNAPVWRRLLVNFAGPMNNFLLAILAFIIYGLFFWCSGAQYQPNRNSCARLSSRRSWS